MADDKLKRIGHERKATECGICGKANPPCPTCPRIDRHQTTDDDRAWQRLKVRDPAEYAVQYPCAKAARMLAITHESHMAYPEYLDEYRRACDARDAFWAQRREGLPRTKGTRHGPNRQLADTMLEGFR